MSVGLKTRYRVSSTLRLEGSLINTEHFKVYKEHFSKSSPIVNLQEVKVKYRTADPLLPSSACNTGWACPSISPVFSMGSHNNSLLSKRLTAVKRNSYDTVLVSNCGSNKEVATLLKAGGHKADPSPTQPVLTHYKPFNFYS